MRDSACPGPYNLSSLLISTVFKIIFTRRKYIVLNFPLHLTIGIKHNAIMSTLYHEDTATKLHLDYHIPFDTTYFKQICQGVTLPVGKKNDKVTSCQVPTPSFSDTQDQFKLDCPNALPKLVPPTWSVEATRCADNLPCCRGFAHASRSIARYESRAPIDIKYYSIPCPSRRCSVPSPKSYKLQANVCNLPRRGGSRRRANWVADAEGFLKHPQEAR